MANEVTASKSPEILCYFGKLQKSNSMLQIYNMKFPHKITIWFLIIQVLGATHYNIYESETVNCNANCTYDGQWKLGRNVSGFTSPSPNVRKAWRHTCQIARFWIKITVSFLMPLKFTLTNKCSLFDRFYVCMYVQYAFSK